MERRILKVTSKSPPFCSTDLTTNMPSIFLLRKSLSYSGHRIYICAVQLERVKNYLDDCNLQSSSDIFHTVLSNLRYVNVNNETETCFDVLTT